MQHCKLHRKLVGYQGVPHRYNTKQSRSCRVWNPKYDKAHEAIPKIVKLPFAWSGLMWTHRQQRSPHRETTLPIPRVRTNRITKVIDMVYEEVCPLEEANLIGPARLLILVISNLTQMSKSSISVTYFIPATYVIQPLHSGSTLHVYGC